MILSKHRFGKHNFHWDAWRNLWSSGSYRYFASQQNGAAIGEVSVIVLLLMKQIRLHLGYKGVQRVLMWYASYSQTDEVSLVLWPMVSQNLRPLGLCGSTSHFVNNQPSKKISGCVLYWRFQPNWSWWRHQMETFSALLAICAGNSPVPGEFPT